MRTNDFEQTSQLLLERFKRLSATIGKMNVERLNTNRPFSA